MNAENAPEPEDHDDELLSERVIDADDMFDRLAALEKRVDDLEGSARDAEKK